MQKLIVIKLLNKQARKIITAKNMTEEKKKIFSVLDKR